MRFLLSIALIVTLLGATTLASAQTQQPVTLVLAVGSPAEPVEPGAALVMPGELRLTVDSVSARLALQDFHATLSLVDAPGWLDATIEPAEMTFRPDELPTGLTWTASGPFELRGVLRDDAPSCSEATIVVEVVLQETSFTTRATSRAQAVVTTTSDPCMQSMVVRQEGEYLVPASADEPTERDVPAPAMLAAPLVALAAAALRRRR